MLYYDEPRKEAIMNKRTKEKAVMPSKTLNAYRISMATNYHRVKEYLNTHDWHYSEPKGKGRDRRVLSGFIGSGKGLFRTFSFTLWVENDLVQSFSTLPFSIPEDKRIRAAEFIVRLNYVLKCGAFELDFSDGEVRYRVIRFGESLVHDCKSAMEYLLQFPVMMIKMHVDGFFDLVQTNKSVESLLKKYI